MELGLLVELHAARDIVKDDDAAQAPIVAILHRGDRHREMAHFLGPLLLLGQVDDQSGLTERDIVGL